MSEAGPPQASIPKKAISISEIPAIEKTRNALIGGREEIKEYVEAPLLAACEEFYDKNIQTLASSCNAKDIAEGKAYIIINFDKLSLENQAVAKTISTPEPYDGVQAVKIEIPITPESDSEKIFKAANAIAGKFHKQRATWIPTYTFEQMKVMYGIKADDNEVEPQSFTGAPEQGFSWYWDEKNQLFYPTQELYEKATEKSV